MMALDKVQTNAESTTIDELWSIPTGRSPSRGKEDIFHTAQEEIPNPYFSQDETGESRQQRNLESYFFASGSIRIPEVADFKCLESAVINEERAAELRPGTTQEVCIPATGIRCKTEFNLRVECQQVKTAIEPVSSGLHGHIVPLHLKFEDIRYKVVLTKRTKGIFFAKKEQQNGQPAEKHILHGISGIVAPGEILAMMGPSGSGKTSMLNILGARVHEGVTGNISYNGLGHSSALKRRIGYVTQDDVLLPILTVRETLVFAALLRLSRTMSLKEKMERAETILRQLGLERCQNTIIGGPFIRGVSGGERKRASIGYELLVDPSLLLLDEPTSGLDSTTALRILQLLRANAQMGRVIVTTIHQPSSRIFYMFDKLILLSEGHPMYYGPAAAAMDYFASLQFTSQLPMNPADFLLDLASGTTSDITLPPELTSLNTCGFKVSTVSGKVMEDHAAAEVGSDTQPECHSLAAAESTVTIQHSPMAPAKVSSEDYQHQLVMKFLRVKYRSELEPREREKLDSAADATLEDKEATKIKKEWNSSWWQQYIILCKRTCRERRKDYLNILRLSQGIAVAILLDMLWWRPKLETEQDIRDQVGLLFYVCIFWCTFSMWSTLMVFPLERNYLAKDRAADMYQLSAYYVSSTCCDLAVELVHPTLFMALVYFLTGLKSNFITFSLTLLSVYLIAITAQAFGEFFGAATLSIKKVGIVSSMIMLIFLLAGGYYVQNIPVFLRWIRYVSIVYYGFHLLLRVQYSPEQTYNCHELGGCLRYDESPIFSDLDLDGGLHDALVLIGMTVVYKSLAYICLHRV